MNDAPISRALIWMLAGLGGLSLQGLPSMAFGQQSSAVLPTVVITGNRPERSLPRQRAFESDSARLLADQPGVQVYEAGGVSSLPVMRGLADDRIRVQVDGMDLMASCPNHMNSPLSYIDASQVGQVRVYAGITPVSAGGDSIAGTIQMDSVAPHFAAEGEAPIHSGRIAGHARSNGGAWGLNLRGDWASSTLALSAGSASTRSNNYRAGADFKPAGPAAPGRAWLDGNEVGSTAFQARNDDLSLALRHEAHQIQLQLGRQHIPFELYPNQRMDMTGNDSTQINLRYSGQYDWGELKARAYQHQVRHRMDMGENRATYGTGMPMDTRSLTQGGSLSADIDLSPAQTLHLGAEGQGYWLYDWWAPVGTGMMAPNTFWNIDYGTRNRVGVYGEWENHWSADGTLLLGLRHDRVTTDAGPVQGYNATSIWADDAAAFNARERQRSNPHWDLSALATWKASPSLALEGGVARKTRSPNLYELYPWSTQPMATLMNNFVGDGNGYIGNPDLRPEVAHTLSVSADWHDSHDAHDGHDTSQQVWSLKLTGYTTQVSDYIDAVRCASPMCGGAANVQTQSGFVNLSYANQSARLQGLDLSARRQLGQSADWGSFSLNALTSYVDGVNTTTGDHLYHQMPLNLKLALTESLASWTHTAEYRAVAAKTAVSQVRNELPTPGYALLTLRSSFERQQLRLDLTLDNVFNRAYALPLGGAYAGQGASMSTTSLPWGITVPGRGRSIDVALSYRL